MRKRLGRPGIQAKAGLLVTAAILVGACSSGGAASSAPAASAPAASASGSTAAKPKNGTQWIVGWTPLSDPIDESRVAFDKGIKDAVEAAGGKELYCSPSGTGGGSAGDPALQANCVDNFIAQGADAIVVYPIDSVAIAAAIQKANTAGIPVFDFTGPIPGSTGVKVALTINPGDFDAGAAAGKAIVDALTKKNGSPKGTILEMQGLMSTQAAQQRGAGFHSVVDGNPDIKVTSKDGAWSTGTATPIIQDWFTAHSDTDAIYMHSDGAYTPAAKSVLEPMGLWQKIGTPKHVILAGEDGSNLALLSVKCGYMDADSDFGIPLLSQILGTQIMQYLQAGGITYTDGQVIQTGNELYPTATIKITPEFAGPIGYVGVTSVTPANADNPNFYGNAVQPPPNGTSACP